MTRWPLFTAFLALSLLPSVGAQASPQGSFHSASVEWSEAKSEPLGNLVALQNVLPTVNDLLAPTNQVPVEDSFFTIQSANLVVKTVAADLYAEIPPAIFTAVPPRIQAIESPAIHRTEAMYTDAEILGTASRSDRALYVLPLDDCQATVIAVKAVGEASTDAGVKAASHFDNREDLRRDVSTAIRVNPEVGSDVVVTGCFVVALWEWDATWTASQGSGLLTSGKANSQGTSDPTGTTGAGVTVSNAQQLYFFAKEGTFTMRGNVQRPPLVFLDSAHIQAAQFTLHEASGRLQGADGPLDVVSQDVVLRGELDAVLMRDDADIASQLHGALESADVDGRPVILATTVSPPTGSAPMLWGLLGAFGLVAVPAALVPPLRAMRRRRVDGLLYVCDRLFEKRAFPEMRALASRVLDVAPRHPEAHVSMARALEQLRQFDDAQAHRTTAHTLLQKAGNLERLAENAFQAADSAASFLSEPVALLWMRQALQAKPGMRDEILNVPTLAPLLGMLESPRPDAGSVPFWLQP
ncbi:MAG: hypothetical protein WC876_07215 [Candidatus Thermoplasmatota archaeon]|jgi:hypothetical protein